MRLAKALLISIMAGFPMSAWFVLGQSGLLGEFGESTIYAAIMWALTILTLVFYFIVSPFILWPRIFNGEDH